MLKANSKKARENIENYILSNINNEYLEECGYGQGVKGLYLAFLVEKCHPNELTRTNGNYRKLFMDWLEGLPSAFHFEFRCWKAALVVGNWLEQTESEVNKYFDKDTLAPYEFYKNTIAEYVMKHKND